MEKQTRSTIDIRINHENEDKLLDKLYSSDIAVLIPTLNEEEGLGPTAKELLRVLGNPYVLVVDGNSTDQTVEVARRFGFDVILQAGKGKGCALAQALDFLKVVPRYVILIDADFTYPAEYLPKMIEILKENSHVGMVCGNRFDKSFRFDEMKSAYYAGNRLLAFAQHLVNGIKMRDPLTGLRVVRYEILKGWKPKSKGFDVEAELNYLVERKGYGIVEIPIHYRKRVGEKKLKLKHGFTILGRILAEALS